MDKTCGTCRWIKYYAVCCIIAATCMVALVSLVLGVCCLAAQFAFWGDAPPFPWFLWRFFVAVGVMASPIIAFSFTGSLAEDHQPKDQPHD